MRKLKPERCPFPGHTSPAGQCRGLKPGQPAPELGSCSLLTLPLLTQTKPQQYLAHWAYVNSYTNIFNWHVRFLPSMQPQRHLIQSHYMFYSKIINKTHQLASHSSSSHMLAGVQFQEPEVLIVLMIAIFLILSHPHLGVLNFAVFCPCFVFAKSIALPSLFLWTRCWWRPW